MTGYRMIIGRLCFSVMMLLVCSTVAIAQNKNKMMDKAKKLESSLAEKEIKAAVQIHKTKGIEPALERLEQGYIKYENSPEAKERPRGYYNKVWAEAQLRSGHDDEEWGLALWSYLFKRTHKKRSLPPDYLAASEYGLLFNLTESGFLLGKIAEMNKWTQKLELSFKKQRGIDTSCETYADLGPIFSFLPQARKRAFPVMIKDFPRTVYPTPSDRCIYYYLMYGLCAVADSYMYKGDWVRAAELNQWCLDYTREALKNPKQLRYPGEVVCFALSRSISMSAICSLHGHPEEASKALDNFIELAGSYDKSREKDVLIAKLERELQYIEMGRMSDNACELADQVLKSMKTQVWNYTRWDEFRVDLARARVYYEAGREKEAWHIVNKLLQSGEKDVNPRHRIRILRTAIELAMLDGAGHPELENWLKETLRNERELGNKFAELWLYEKYAEFLVLRSRYAEAERIQREVVRLAKAMRLPDRMASAMLVLADIRERLNVELVAAHTPVHHGVGGSSVPGHGHSHGQITNAAPGTATSGNKITVDIQPRKSTSLPIEGGTGFARFFLNNLSSHDCSGVLQITGPVTNLLHIDNTVIAAKVSAGLNSVTLEENITLAADTSCIIDLSGTPLGQGEEAIVDCAWLPAGATGATATASWTYQAGETVQRTSVINAHELQQSPFCFVPLYHTLQRPHTNQLEIVDVVVVASKPIRIEVYDAHTFELVYIDANGDGDFEDKGDLIASDNNHNLQPDLTLPEGTHLRSFLMHILPSHGSVGRSTIELEVNVLHDNDWIVDAVDIVEFE